MKLILTLFIIHTLLFAFPYDQPENTQSKSTKTLISEAESKIKQLKEKLNKIENRLSNTERALEKYNNVLKEKQERLTTLTQTEARCNNYQLELDEMIRNKYKENFIKFKREQVENCKSGYQERVDFFRNLTVLLNEVSKDADDLATLAKIDRDFAYELKESIKQKFNEIDKLKGL